MSELKELLAEYILNRYGSTAPRDVIDNTELECIHTVLDELELMREKGLLTKDYYRTDGDRQDIPRYYQTVELENKYYYLF